MRLTASVRQQLLDQNDGFEAQTHNESKNSRESRVYRIERGELRIRSRGEDVVGRQPLDNEFVADSEQTSTGSSDPDLDPAGV